MYGVGVDIGSTYTKYCVMDEAGQIVRISSERTPVRQSRDFFDGKVAEMLGKGAEYRLVSCGYGRRNVSSSREINEITALGRGIRFTAPAAELVLDIGGQDTKLIRMKNGSVGEFFVNEKCAAGSGLFLSSICSLLETTPDILDLTDAAEPEIKLSAVCAVFAQSEIVELLARGVSEDEILRAVVWQILVKSRPLLDKTVDTDVVLSGGLTEIKGIAEFAGAALGRRCTVQRYSRYLSAIGSALVALEGVVK